MAVLDWPEKWIPQASSFQLVRASQQFRSPLNGTIQAIDFPGERWQLSATLPERRQSAGLQSFLNQLAGGANRVRVWPFHMNGVPRGTARGAMTLSASMAQFGTLMWVKNALAGRNMLRRATSYSSFYSASSWTAVNSTCTEIASDKPFVSGAPVLRHTVTGSGNSYQYCVLPATGHADAPISCRVWLRAGTLPGTVALRLRDGSLSTEYASKSVTPTSSWQAYELHGVIGGAPAANLVFYVDPTNTGTAGQYLDIFYGEIEWLAGRGVNTDMEVSSYPDPNREFGGFRLLRKASGALWWQWPGGPCVAGDTFTFSVWLKDWTSTGLVNVTVRDSAGTAIAVTQVQPTSSWQRYVVTGTFSADQTQIYGVVSSALSGGAANDSLTAYGAQLEPGPSVSPYSLRATLLADDFVGCNGQLFQVASDTTFDVAGAGGVTVVNRARSLIAAGSAVTWDRPTCAMLVPAAQVGPNFDGSGVRRTELDAFEVW